MNLKKLQEQQDRIEAATGKRVTLHVTFDGGLSVIIEDHETDFVSPPIRSRDLELAVTMLLQGWIWQRHTDEETNDDSEPQD